MKLARRALFLLLAAVVPAEGAVTSLPADHPAYAAVAPIYRSVARAFGDSRLPPRLVVMPGGTRNRLSIAWIDAGSEGGAISSGGTLQESSIVIEERAIDILSSLGKERDSALAFLLGHELAHYYLRHASDVDLPSFVETRTATVGGGAVPAVDIDRMEREADYFGGFYAYAAGYDTLGIIPRTLDLLYSGYGLPDRQPNYPGLAERKAIAEQTRSRLQGVLPLFDAANRLLVVGRTEEAGRLFAYLARSFPSRELFNNAGVAYAREAVRLLPRQSAAYVYPFLCDHTIAVLSGGSRSGEKERGVDLHDGRRRRLLELAADMFGQVLQRDSEDLAALVNLACVQSLRGHHDLARGTANSAVAVARKGNAAALAEALIARGIVLAMGGDAASARADFLAARHGSPEMAGRNLALLNATPEAPGTLPGEILVKGQEYIGGLSPGDPFPKDRRVRTITLDGGEYGPAPKMVLKTLQQDGWLGTRMESAAAVSLVATLPGYAGKTSRGVRIGTSLSRVEALYGAAQRVVSFRNGRWLVYPKNGIAFFADSADSAGRIAGWLLFDPS